MDLMVELKKLKIMKRLKVKLLFGVAVAMLLSGGAVLTYLQAQPVVSGSDLVAANIEAMADNEVNAGYVRTISHTSGDEEGSWTADGSKFCVPHWESTACYDETPAGEWCQSYYTRTVNCH